MNNGIFCGLGIDIFRFSVRISYELHTSLIKSGGGNGPMKPGNLRIFESERCQIRRQTRDKDSIEAHIESLMCALFFLADSCVDSSDISRSSNVARRYESLETHKVFLQLSTLRHIRISRWYHDDSPLRACLV